MRITFKIDKEYVNQELKFLPSQVANLIEEAEPTKQLLLEANIVHYENLGVNGIEDVCKQTGCTKNIFYQYLHQKTTPYHKLEYGGRKLIFFRTEIENWLKGKNPETSEKYCERKELELYNSMNGGLN